MFSSYKDLAYVYVGRLPYDLTEGVISSPFSHSIYGEVVDVNLARDQGTGKSKGFAFVAYEDQRSTNLAVDNLNGAKVLGRIIKVEHRGEYLKREEEEYDETKKKKRERPVVSAELFREGSVLVEILANFLTMKTEVLIPVGELKIGQVPGEIE